MKHFILSVSFVFLNISNSFSQLDKSQFCDKKMVGYVASWSPTTAVDYAGMTHAFFAFLKPSNEGSVVEFSAEEETALYDYLKKTKKYGCKRFISLGGGGDEAFPIMAASPEARQKFISTVIEFCQEKKFDGIDMDWEAMDNEAKKKNYTLIMKEFRQACNAAGLQLTATIGYGDYWCKWIENEALKQADWIQLMIYDQTATWAASPFGNHASFDHYLEAEKYWTNRGFTKDKLVMGLPFYGYRFNSRDGGQGTSVLYSEIAAAFPSLSPAADQTPGEDLCFFNGPETIKKKTNYALENGFGGVMVWEMSQDSQGEKSLQKAIIEAFKNYCEKKSETK